MSDLQQNDNIPAELLKSLQVTTALMQNLLDDIKEHSASLALIKVKIENLGDNVSSLSHIVRDGNGESMVTRLALAERELTDLREEFRELKNIATNTIKEAKRYAERDKTLDKKSVEEEKKYSREKSIAKWKFWGVLIAAFAALALQLFQIIAK